jgi:Ca2+-binding EF-hand superfamily protein
MSRASWVGGGAVLALSALVMALPGASRASDVAPSPRAVQTLAPWTHAVRPLAPAPRSALPEVAVNDTVEVVVFSPARPVRIRVHVQHSGKSLAESWIAALRKTFDYFDRDHDGVLNAKEVELIFSDQALTLMLQSGNGFYQPTPGNRPTLARLDLNGDGVVSFAEFVAYYRNSVAQVLRTTPTTPENPADAAVTESLFNLLDVNRDGKLTRAEVSALEKLLPQLDEDEDECLSLNELSPNAFNRVPRQLPAVTPTTPRAAKTSATQIVMSYMPGRIPGTMTQQLIRKYDRDGDFELTLEESGFDTATFARLDLNSDGKLDGEELDLWRTGEPDLEVGLSYGVKLADCRATLLTDRKLLESRGFKFNQVNEAKLVLRLGRHPIELSASPSIFNGRPPATKQQFDFLFSQAAGKKGYVDEKDLSGPNAVQFQLLRVLFDAADADADGKLTRQEFNRFFDLQDEFRTVALAVSPAIRTPTLFQLLDANHDNRLSVREMRLAWDRLIELEPPGSLVVTRAAIQPTISIRLIQNAERAMAGQFQVDLGFQQQMGQVPVPQKGPLWFRKMDRNGDGDVSRAEFIGSSEEFDAIDANHDGLISLEEAEAYDKKMRSAPEKAGNGNPSDERKGPGR